MSDCGAVLWAVETTILVLHSEIRMTPQRACSVIGACAVLHNIAVLLNG